MTVVKAVMKGEAKIKFPLLTHPPPPLVDISVTLEPLCVFETRKVCINTGLGAMFNPVITTSKPKLLISLFSRVQDKTEVKVHDYIEFIKLRLRTEKKHSILVNFVKNSEKSVLTSIFFSQN